MKRLIVAAAVALVGCSGSRPAADAAPKGGVVLATFTVDVDLTAGTFVVRTTPDSSGAPAGMAALVNLNADVTVANSGSPWINTESPACTSGSSPTTWGAAVTVTNNLPGTFLSGVYAEITDFGGGVGAESCSSAPAPTGLDPTKGGLWSYGAIHPGATTAPRNWIFKFLNATQFTFRGRIMGVKVDLVNFDGGSPRFVSTYLHALGDNGTTVVVAHDPDGIDFVDSTTGAFQQTVATPARANAVGVAPNRIWWGTGVSTGSVRVGWMDSDGANASSATMAPAGVPFTTGGITAIVPDPTFPDTKVWVLYRDGSADSYVWSYTIGTGPGTPIALGGLGYSAAIGSDGRLYVPLSSNVVRPLSLSTDPATQDPPVDSSAMCLWPFFITLGADSKLYIGCRSGYSRVVSMTNAGEFTNLGTVSHPAGIAASASGEVWVAALTGIRRMAESPYDAVIGTSGSWTDAVMFANGYLWATMDGLLWRVTTQ